MFRLPRSPWSNPPSAATSPPLLDASALEPRLLFNAGPLAAALPEVSDLAASPQATQVAVAGESFSTAEPTAEAAPATESAARLELVFVDAGIEDQQTLIEDIRRESSDAELRIYLLDAGEDGIEQMTEMISEQGWDDDRPIDAIHVVSHGSDARLRLGNSVVDADTLDGYAGLLTSWRSHLAADADVLLYGCDLAETAEGRTLVEAIAELTGTDVAASTDDTGSTPLGGDWVLEHRSGQVDSASLFAADALIVWRGLLAAPEIETTGEQLISTPASRFQELDSSHQSVAVDGAGNTIVVWTDHHIDGDGTAIAMRRFNAAGDPIGAVVQVNTVATGNQFSAVVTADTSGNIAVAWVSQDGFGTGIFVRRFDADGDPIDDADILVNSGNENGTQANVSIASNDNNQIVLAWDSNISDSGVYARTFDFTTPAPGNALTTPLLTVSADSGAADPAIDINANGRFVVTWNDATDLWGQRFDYATASAVGPTLNLDSVFANNSQSVVAVLPNNDYAVVYRSDSLFTSGVYGRVVSEDNTVTVATLLSGDSEQGTAPAIATDAAGNIAIAYTDEDADGSGVYYRIFDSDGTAITSILQANQSTSDQQRNPSIALHDPNNLVIVWSGFGDQPGQADDDGVFLRQFGTGHNTDPIARADTGSPYSVPQGGTLSLDGSASFDADGDPLTYAWDLDNDGVFGESDEPTTAVASVDWSTLVEFGIEAVGSYTVGLRVEDDDGGTSTATATVEVTNVLPTVVNATQTLVYSEDAASIDLGNIVVNDPYAGETITVTLTNTQPATGSLNVGVYGGSNSVYDAESGRWRIIGSLDDVNAALSALAFTPAADNDVDTQLIVQVIDSSGFGPADGLIELHVTAVNDPPLVDLDHDNSGDSSGGDYQTTFTEGDAAVWIADPTDAVLEDIDSGTLSFLRIEIENPADGAIEILSADVSGTNITADFANATLTLAGTDSVAAYQQVLRTVRYENTSVNPDTTPRRITVVANDGESDSVPVDATVNVVAVNQPPVVTHPPRVEGGENVASAIPGLAMSDVDIGQGDLRLLLRVDNGFLTLDTRVASGITANQVQGNGTGSLIVTAPVAAINNTLASSAGLIYRGVAEFAGTDVLTVQAGDAAATTQATVMIDVVQNDAPIARDDRYTVSLDETLSVNGAGLLGNDLDPEGQAMSVSLVSGPPSGSLTLLPDGTFRFRPSPASPELVSFSYVASDGVNTSDRVSVTITVERPTPADIQSSTANSNQDSQSGNESQSESGGEDQTDQTQTREEILAPITEVIKDAATGNEVLRGGDRETAEAGEGEASVSSDTDTQTSQRGESDEELFRETIGQQRDTVTMVQNLRPDSFRPDVTTISIDSFDGQMVWDDFVELKQQFGDVAETSFVFAGQFAGVTSALSVGYVLWTIRSGLLATSLLAHLPAWTVVDPLLVLTDLDATDDDEDDDSLEGMLDQETTGEGDEADASDEAEMGSEPQSAQQTTSRTGKQD